LDWLLQQRRVFVHVDSVATEPFPPARPMAESIGVMPRRSFGHPTREFDPKWGKPDLFLSMTYIGMLRHTHEIGGIL
jgi:hypothetical protein